MEVKNEEIKVTKQIEKKEKQRGASLVEYALLVALISVVSVVAMRILGQRVSSQFSSVASQL